MVSKSTWVEILSNCLSTPTTVTKIPTTRRIVCRGNKTLTAALEGKDTLKHVAWRVGCMGYSTAGQLYPNQESPFSWRVHTQPQAHSVCLHIVCGAMSKKKKGLICYQYFLNRRFHTESRFQTSLDIRRSGKTLSLHPPRAKMGQGLSSLIHHSPHHSLMAHTLACLSV